MIDRWYAFADIVEAHRYVDTGRKRGNVVIAMVEAATGGEADVVGHDRKTGA